MTMKKIQRLVKKGELKLHHETLASTYIKKDEIKIEPYAGHFGKGYKVYEHMIGGSNGKYARFHKAYLTYYVYTNERR